MIELTTNGFNVTMIGIGSVQAGKLSKPGELLGEDVKVTVKSDAGKGTSGNSLSHLTKEQQQIIKNAETVSTAKPGKQVTAPRDLSEQVVWKQVQENPGQAGRNLDDMNTDPRFPASAGFQKMTASHRLPDGKVVEVHYQYNSNTDKAYDMKIVTPQRVQANPKDIIDSMKDKTK